MLNTFAIILARQITKGYTMTKITNAKDINFTELKFLANLKGYQELELTLNNGSERVGKYIDEYIVDPKTKRNTNIVKEKVLEIQAVMPKEIAVKVRQQANEFGYRVDVTVVDRRKHFRSTKDVRLISIGKYAGK